MKHNYTKIRNQLLDGIDYKRKVRFIDIDFTKPWWNPLICFKWWSLRMFLSLVYSQIVSSLFPVLIAFSISQRNFNLIIILVSFRLLHSVIIHWALRVGPVLNSSLMSSLELSAAKFFLTVDPIFHSNKSSGQIISKVTKATNSYDSLINIILFQLIQPVVSLITVIGALWVFDCRYMLAGITGLFLVISGSAIFSWLSNLIFTSELIKLEDKTKHQQVENLQQSSYIRSIFYSSEKLKTYKKDLKDRSVMSATYFRFGEWAITIPYNLVWFSVIALSFLILGDIQSDKLDPTVGSSLMIIYLSSVWGLTFIGEIVSRLSRNISDVVDLFNFIKGFGKQTYPVLGEDI